MPLFIRDKERIVISDLSKRDERTKTGTSQWRSLCQQELYLQNCGCTRNFCSCVINFQLFQIVSFFKLQYVRLLIGSLDIRRQRVSKDILKSRKKDTSRNTQILLLVCVSTFMNTVYSSNVQKVRSFFK